MKPTVVNVHKIAPNSVLHCAISKRNWDLMLLLLKMGASLDQRCERYTSCNLRTECRFRFTSSFEFAIIHQIPIATLKAIITEHPFDANVEIFKIHQYFQMEHLELLLDLGLNASVAVLAFRLKDFTIQIKSPIIKRM